MLLSMLKSKIHRATVTEADLHYEGSIAVDRALIDAAGLLPFEQVDIYNITNGNRFSTYVIESDFNSGTIMVNGAAARLVVPGDLVIICSYAHMELQEAAHHTPVVILVDEQNRIKHHG